MKSKTHLGGFLMLFLSLSDILIPFLKIYDGFIRPGKGIVEGLDVALMSVA